MYRKRLAALVMTGCMLTSAGCTTPSSGSGPLGLGLFSGCCGHTSSSSGGGVFGRMFGSGSSPAVASAQVVGGSYAGGVDCPCSHHGGSDGIYHPAVLSQGMGGAPVTGGIVMGDMGAPPTFPTQQFQSPVTTPGVAPNMSQPPYMPGQIPGSAPGSNPNAPPRIQPIPQAPMSGNVAPSSGFAPPQNWAPPQH